VLYIVVAVVATGLLPSKELEGSEGPLGDALSKGAGFGFGATVIAVGALIAITSVVLTFLYGQTRIMFSMCRDGLLPRSFGKVSARTRTPVRITVTFGLAIALLAAFLPLTELAKLVNVGTLFAFILVNVGVIVLRRTTPDAARGYRVPFVPVFPIIGSVLCLVLIFFLEDPATTLIRFVIWLAIGLVIYFVYGRSHSVLRHGETGAPEPEVS
jgi:APA family basic amino acid/polyamine antiporter